MGLGYLVRPATKTLLARCRSRGLGYFGVTSMRTLHLYAATALALILPALVAPPLMTNATAQERKDQRGAAPAARPAPAAPAPHIAAPVAAAPHVAAPPP